MYQHLIILLLMGLNQMSATSFIPIPVEEQLRDSDGIIIGVAKSSASRKNEHEQIVTDYKIKVTSYVGLKNVAPINQQLLTLTVPGGKWNGVITKRWGTPEIKTEKEFLAIVTKQHATYELLNSGLSFFTKERNSDVWKSSFFSSLNGVGNIIHDDVIYEAEKIFGSEHLAIKSDKQVYKRKKSSRSPASVEIDPGKKEFEGVFTIWLFLSMAFLLVVSQYIIRRNR